MRARARPEFVKKRRPKQNNSRPPPRRNIFYEDYVHIISHKHAHQICQRKQQKIAGGRSVGGLPLAGMAGHPRAAAFDNKVAIDYTSAASTAAAAAACADDGQRQAAGGARTAAAAAASTAVAAPNGAIPSRPAAAAAAAATAAARTPGSVAAAHPTSAASGATLPFRMSLEEAESALAAGATDVRVCFCVHCVCVSRASLLHNQQQTANKHNRIFPINQNKPKPL
jgi:hypothetical protein